MVVVVVQAKLTDGHDLGMASQRANFIKVSLSKMPGVVGMQPHGGVNPVMSLGHRHGTAKRVRPGAPTDCQQVA